MNRETIMEALFAKLTTAPLVLDFVATVTHGSEVLSVSDATGLFVGLPISGPGVPEGAILATTDPEVTISRKATGTHPSVTLRQGFKFFSRRLQSWEECSEQPALFLCDADEIHPDRPSSAAARITLAAEAYVYTKAGQDPDEVPAKAINRFIDAIEQAIDPSPKSATGMWGSLGLKGVVHCRIEGDLIKAVGDSGSQSLAMVPIKILVAQGVATR